MKKNKGFSLVELIIVIAILAVLVGIIAPRYLGYVEKSKKSRALANCETVVRTAEVHMTDTGDVVLEFPYDVIKQKSNVQGIINEILNESSAVTYLKYTEDYVVIYQNGVYTIEGEASSEEEEPVVGKGHIMIDIDGVEHIFEASIDNDEFKESISSSQSGGVSIAKGTILKEGDNYYVVGDNNWFAKSNTEKDISGYGNVISIDGSKVYTENDRVSKYSDQVWPSPLPKGTVCYYKNKYYISPREINIYTMPPGGWIEINH